MNLLGPNIEFIIKPITNMKGIFSSHRPIYKVFEWVILICIFSALCIGLWALIWGRTDLSSLKWLQVLQSLGLFLLPSLAAAYLWSEEPTGYLHLNTRPAWQDLCFGVVIIILSIPAINLLSYLNQQLTLPPFLSDLEAFLKEKEKAALDLTEWFMYADNIGILTLNVMFMALLPAICEESCFRGILQGLFSGNTTAVGKQVSRSQHMAIWATAFIFSFIHFQFYGFLPRLLLGALLGYLLVWTGSLWVPIVTHFTNNALSVIAYYICTKSNINIDEIDALGTEDTLWLGILSIALVSTAIYFYCRRRLNTKA